MTQWFYIYTAMGSEADPFVLNAWGGKAGQNVPVKLYGVEGNPQSWQNELWSFTSDGYIVSALGQNMVLGVDNGNVVIQTQSTNNPSQQWTILQGPAAPGKSGTNLALIQNKQSGNLLNVSGGGSPSNGQQVITYPNQSWNPPNQCWAIVPCMPATGQSLLIATNLSSMTSPLLLNVQGESLEPGTPTIIWPPAANAQNEVWQFTVDGYIVSGLNDQLVLSLGPDNTVVTYARQPNNQSFQLWAVTPDGAIVNQSNGQALTVPGGSASQGTALVTTPLNGAPTTAQQWTLYPGFPLDAILAQAPVPFPAFTGDQATAYSDINAQLGLANDGGLRGQYSNLAAPLSSYQNTIDGMSCPANVTNPQDWTDVVDQLNTELTDAIAVRSLFSQMQTFYNTLTEEKILSLSAIANIVGVSSSSDVRGVVGTIFEGLLYTGLSAAGDGYGVVANLMQTGINAIQASSGNNVLGSFSGKVSALESQLASAVIAVTKSLGQQETVILQDWWKMQQVYALTKLPITDPNSLAWPAEVSGDLLQALVPGYNVSVLQILMPALYKICRWVQIPNGQSGPRTSAPGYAKWSQSLPGNVSSYFEVSQHEESDYPSSALMDMVWGNDVKPENFYYRVGGWNQFNNSEMGWVPPPQGGPHLCNMLVVNFVNRTANALAITVTGAHYNCLSWNYYQAGPAPASGTATVPAYGELSVALWTNVSSTNDISASVSISSGGSQVLSMNCHQDWCLMSAGTVSVSPSSGSGSQNFSYSSDCTAGAYKDDRWGSIEIYISQ